MYFLFHSYEYSLRIPHTLRSLNANSSKLQAKCTRRNTLCKPAIRELTCVCVCVSWGAHAPAVVCHSTRRLNFWVAEQSINQSEDRCAYTSNQTMPFGLRSPEHVYCTIYSTKHNLHCTFSMCEYCSLHCTVVYVYTCVHVILCGYGDTPLDIYNR